MRRLRLPVLALSALTLGAWLGWRMLAPSQAAADGAAPAFPHARDAMTVQVGTNFEAALDGPRRPVEDTQPVSVKRDGSELVIELEDASRRQAAESLADLTHAVVHGIEHLGGDAERVSLHWRGTDPALAWSALLSGVPNTAISCGRTCEVWILNAHRAANGPFASGRPLVPGEAVQMRAARESTQERLQIQARPRPATIAPSADRVPPATSGPARNSEEEPPESG